MAQVKKDKDHIRGEKKQRGHICRQLRVLLLVMLQGIRYLLELLTDKLFGLYYNSKVKKVEEAPNPIVLESATSLARKIRKRELTSEEVVKAFIERIKQVNSVINAVVDNRFGDAIKEAKQIDKEILNGSLIDVDFQQKPFLGVPFTTKETTACKGLSNTFGLFSRKSRKALFDAEIVENMKEAGFILLAVTNVPQLNLWQETSNPVYGRTNNPYDSTRNVGGSSGGESSILAACGSPIGLGTDIGGSLRIPAFMCGIFGHKPTCNIVSTNGLTFRTGKETNTMVVAGPMSRYSEDLIPCLKVLAGPNLDKLNLDDDIDIKDIKIFYVSNPNDPLVSPFRNEIKQIFQKVVNHFTEILPEKPELLNIPELKFGGRIWKYWMSQESEANFNRDLANREGEINSITELVKFCVGSSDFTLAVMFNLINNLLPKVDPVWAKDITNTIHNQLTSALGTNGVLIYPSAPWPANYHYTAFLRPWNLHLWAIWNALKFPVTQVPLGLSGEGLPLGVQVVAPPFQDRLCLAVAKELEKAFGGFVPPFPVKQ